MVGVELAQEWRAASSNLPAVRRPRLPEADNHGLKD